MALGVPSSSPAVVIKEIDASTSIRTASTTIGGTVGNFPLGTSRSTSNCWNRDRIGRNFCFTQTMQTP